MPVHGCALGQDWLVAVSLMIHARPIHALPSPSTVLNSLGKPGTGFAHHRCG